VSGGHGTITPDLQQTDYGSTATLTLSPDEGYAAASVTGCGGALADDGVTYVTGPVTADCEVVATFGVSSADIIFSNGFETVPQVCEPEQLFEDPSLELETVHWDSYDSQYGTSFCDASCDSTGTIHAHSGIIFAWMGGSFFPVHATLSQSVVIPSGQDRWVNFWEIDQLTDAATLTLSIDGNQVADFPGGPISISYALQSFQVPAVYADGQSHTIMFTYDRPMEGEDPAGVMLDDITLDCAATQSRVKPITVAAALHAAVRKH